MQRIPRPEPLALLTVLVFASLVPAQDLRILPNPLLDAPFPITVADVNGDALPDIVTAGDYYGEPVVAWLGQGNGTFGKSMLLHEVSEQELVGSFDVVDVTGDGLQDIVAAHAVFAFGANVDVQIGLATGSFSSPVTTELPTYSTGAVELVDMDVDGLPDFCSLAVDFPDPLHFASLVIERSTGIGTFDLLQEFGMSHDIFWSPPLASADFSQDGFPDLATTVDLATAATDDLAIFVGAGDGTVLAPPVTWPFPAGPLYSPDFVVGDLDLDGVPDLIVAAFTGSGGLVSVLHWNAGFTPVQGSLQPNFSGGFPTVGDVDSDGWMDVLVAGQVGSGPTATHSLAILMNDGTGDLLPPATMNLPQVGPPLLADLDGDSITDLFCGETIYFGHGDGTFALLPTLAFEVPIEVVSTDLDADGDQDLLVGRQFSGEGLGLALGEGDGTFDGPQFIAGDWPNVDTIAVGDVDGDLDPDLAIKANGKASIRLNDGSGLAFTPTGDVFEPQLSDLALGDLDGDADLDLVATGLLNKTFVWFGDGTGHFVAGPEPGLVGDGQDVSLADLDADGVTDIVAAMGVSAAVALALGIGDGTFGTAQELPQDLYAAHLLVQDLNGDDLPDLAFGAALGVELDVQLANAPATFGPATAYTLGAEMNALGAADVNVDGHPDLLIASKEGKSLGLLTNLGSGDFGAELLHLADYGAQALAAADFDGDGHPDVAVACRQSNKVTIHGNELSPFPNLGYQLPTSAGTTQLVGAGGEPVPDELVSFSLEGVPQSAPGILVLGLEFAPMPFHGGTLVPSPDVALVMPPDGPIFGRWPHLPAGAKIYAQAWFATGGEFAGTNAIFGATK